MNDRQKKQRDVWRKRQQKRQERMVLSHDGVRNEAEFQEYKRQQAANGSTFTYMKVTMSPGVNELLAHQLVLAVEERYKGRPLEIPRGCVLEADGQKYTVLIDHQKREILVWLGDALNQPVGV